LLLQTVLSKTHRLATYVTDDRQTDGHNTEEEDRGGERRPEIGLHW